MMFDSHSMMLAAHWAHDIIQFPLYLAVNMIWNKSVHNSKF